ncbi:hypothetical protein FF1_026294 [Malus domestica]
MGESYQSLKFRDILPCAGIFYAFNLANLPEEVKKELEDPHSRYNFGWSHGKEKLEFGKPDTLKGSFYANPILDSPTTDESLIQRYPSYCGSNIWPNSELPELEVTFKALGKLILGVGLMVAYHCDRYERIKNALSPNVEELMLISDGAVTEPNPYSMPGAVPFRKALEYAIHLSGLTATYKLHGHNNGLRYWPIGPQLVPGSLRRYYCLVREAIVNVVNYNCGGIQQQPRFEAQLRSLLPQITSAFGANKSVLVTIDELKKQQQSSDATVVEWAKEPLQGLGNGAPLSLYLTQNYFSKVASALAKNDNQLSSESYFLPFRFIHRMSCRRTSVLNPSFLRRCLPQNVKWNPSKLEEVNQSEMEALFEPLVPNIEVFSV